MHLKSLTCSLPVSPVSEKHFILSEPPKEGERPRRPVVNHFQLQMQQIPARQKPGGLNKTNRTHALRFRRSFSAPFTVNAQGEPFPSGRRRHVPLILSHNSLVDPLASENQSRSIHT